MKIKFIQIIIFIFLILNFMFVSFRKNKNSAVKTFKEKNVDIKVKNEIKKLACDILEKNKKPMIKINISEIKPNLFQSKFGGIPYISRDGVVPKNEENKQLTLLAQINIEELPKNNIYPMKKGILQFWILNDIYYGLNLDKSSIKNYKIVYYENIDKTVTKEEVLKKYNPYSEEENYFPISGEFSLKFTLTEGYISDNELCIEEILFKSLKEICDKNNQELESYEIIDILMEDEEIFNKMFNSSHKIGGYPNFCQYDIRDVNDDYEVLLLQIDSDETDIIWGDCGIANFFIREKDLKELNFDNVLYNWDCY